jgi:hypothetical protein
MILCRRVETRAAGRAWVSALPVSAHDWASFVRSGAIADAAYWPDGRPRTVSADSILTRIGYRWADRDRPVGAITWDEAHAYCVHAGGRLPWWEEWQALEVAFGRLESGQMGRLAEGLLDAHREIAGDRGCEWCADPYSPHAHGPNVVPEPPLRRSITGPPGRLVPSHHDRRVGFRVAFDVVTSTCGIGVEGWEWVDVASPHEGQDADESRRTAPPHRRFHS